MTSTHHSFYAGSKRWFPVLKLCTATLRMSGNNSNHLKIWYKLQVLKKFKTNIKTNNVE